jgi:hypothetical protein
MSAVSEAAATGVAPKWTNIATSLGTGRVGKQCRDRYVNFLAPGILRGEWSLDEEKTLTAGYSEYGGKWAEIARALPGRTESAVKNFWHATLRLKGRAAAGHSLPRHTKLFQLSRGLGNPIEGLDAAAALNAIVVLADGAAGGEEAASGEAAAGDAEGGTALLLEAAIPEEAAVPEDA